MAPGEMEEVVVKREWLDDWKQSGVADGKMIVRVIAEEKEA